MKTILVVDDEYALVESLTELLQDEGYRVISAGNGREGLATLQKEKPDLVVVDLMMPIADGRELVRGMRSLADHRSIPVVMMSAAAREVALPIRDRSLNVARYLQKPFRFEKILEAIEQLVGKGDESASRDYR
jgi:two-component system response regulator VicR